MTHLQSGALRALAITSEKRWPTTKDVPTISEAGYPGFSHMTWIGVLAPSGTPGAIVTRLNQEIAAVLATAEVRERIVRTGAEPVVRSAAQFEDMLKSEYEATGKLVAKIGIKVE
jgi:tripartite-type tricarboxylate transporter receptor subunit TctC